MYRLIFCLMVCVSILLLHTLCYAAITVDKEYFEDGNLKIEKIIVDDEVKVIKHYYLNGKLKSHVEYGLEDGIDVVKSYYDNGNLMGVMSFKDGKVLGTVKTFNKDGTVMEERHLNTIEEIQIFMSDMFGYDLQVSTLEYGGP